MDETPRYATLQDYIRVIRRRKLLIAVATLVATLIALTASLARDATYEATAQVSVRDVTQDLDLLGFGSSVFSGETPGQRAATYAELVTAPAVTARVARELGGDIPEDELPDAVSTRVALDTNLVVLTAQAGDADLAAQIANAFAEETVKANNRDVSQRLAEFERSAQREYEEARGRGGTGFSQLELAAMQERVSRIRTLRDLAEPAVIAEQAQTPDSPVSPVIARDTVMGGLLGLIVGLIAAFARHALDRRLHSAHETAEELGMPVLGRVSDTALGYPGLAVRNGGVPMREADFEAFRMLRNNLGFLADDGPMRSVLVTSGLPEEGKSTVSMSLASACVIAGQRVLLIECDLRRPSFARRLGINAQPGLTDYLQGSAAPRDVLQIAQLTDPVAGNGGQPPPESAASTLVCITAGSPVSRPAEFLISERFREFLTRVKKAYELIVIDASPLLSVVDPLELVQHVDGVLVCARVGRTTREELHAARAALGNLPERPMGAVVTGLSAGGPDSYDYYYGV